MAAVRTTVTIPDALNKRLEAVKTRINVSGICQEAIEKAVSLEEAKMKAATKRDEAIARLKVEREKADDEWLGQGKTDGLSDAPNLSYEDFKWLEELQQEISEHYELDAEYAVQQIQGHESFDWLFERLEEIECSQKLQTNYISGWLEAVVDFWDDIKEEVE